MAIEDNFSGALAIMYIVFEVSAVESSAGTWKGTYMQVRSFHGL